MTEDTDSRQCHMAFISMALGIFVLVCSAVIAGTLLSTALSDQIVADELTKTLSTYEDIGSVMFAMGDELVSSMDLISSDDKAKAEGIVVAQKITNKAVNKVKENLSNRWRQSSNYVMDEVEEKKEILRDLIAWDEPVSAIKSFTDLSEWLFENCLEMDSSSTLRQEVSTYLVFIKGMSQRFGEMSLASIYVKSDIPINGLQMLTFRVRGMEAIEVAFNFAPKAQSKLEELRTHAQNVTSTVVEDSLTTQSLRNSNFSTVYAEAVKEEIARLFLAKEILNDIVYSLVKDASDRAQKNIYFKMIIVIVSVAALILCLIFSLISRAVSTRNPVTGSREFIYQNF